MAETEDIEAKLAAFVDGDIDAVGRAEIEKHLASHPRHRELLNDLARQRDLLRALPRDMAPSDVAETINSQLERAVLLGDVDSGTDIAGSIGRWSQLRAIAAVLLLTGGLAGVIYYLLSFPGRHNPELADLRISAPPTTVPALVELATAPPADVDAALAPTTAPVLSDVSSRPQIAMNDDQPVAVPGGFGGRAGPDGLAGRGFDPQAIASNVMPPRQEVFSDVLQTRSAAPLVRSSPAELKPESVYVLTDNPESTGRDLRQYLQNNNIVWEAAAPEPMPKPLDASQQQSAFASRQQQIPMMQLKSAPEPPAAQDDSQSIKPAQERIVARQVTREQAVALRDWLDRRQLGGAHKDDADKTLATDQLPSIASGIPATLPGQTRADAQMPNEMAPTTAPAPENSPTTLPFTVEAGLNEVLEFAPPRLDAPGIELDSHRANQTLAAPTTQMQETEVQQLTLGEAPTTSPDATGNQRMDVVIVLESQPAVIPATLPAATEPALSVPEQQP